MKWIKLLIYFLIAFIIVILVSSRIKLLVVIFLSPITAYSSMPNPIIWPFLLIYSLFMCIKIIWTTISGTKTGLKPYLILILIFSTLIIYEIVTAKNAKGDYKPKVSADSYLAKDIYRLHSIFSKDCNNITIEDIKYYMQGVNAPYKYHGFSRAYEYKLFDSAVKPVLKPRKDDLAGTVYIVHDKPNKKFWISAVGSGNKLINGKMMLSQSNGNTLVVHGICK